MVSTPNIGIEYFDPNQQGVSTTLNTNALLMDALIMSFVTNMTTQTPPGSPDDGDTYIISGGAGLAITAVNDSTPSFTIAGDHESTFSTGKVFIIKDSTGNDDISFTVLSSTYTTSTVITVTPAMPDTTADGSIYIALGDWNGYVDAIVQNYDSTWYFYEPKEGWGFVYNIDVTDNYYFYFDGENWANASGIVGAGLVSLTPGTDARNVVTPSGDYLALTLKGNAAQTKDLLQLKDTDDNIIFAFSETDGYSNTDIKMGIGTGASIETSAILECKSTSQGFILPRMTTYQRNNISSPVEGLEIFNTDTKKKNLYNGTAWRTIVDGA